MKSKYMVSKEINYLAELRSVEVLFDNIKYMITQHLSSPVAAGVKVFYCTILKSTALHLPALETILLTYIWSLCTSLYSKGCKRTANIS